MAAGSALRIKLLYAVAGSIGGAAVIQFHSRWKVKHKAVHFPVIAEKPSSYRRPFFGLTQLNASGPGLSCKTEIEALGYPSDENLLFKNNYILSYNRRLRNANWVFEVLTYEHCYNKAADRKLSTFLPDESIPQQFRAIDEDFFRSGYDRGHLAAAGNHFHNQSAMDDTFLFTNISPQVGNGFNRHSWNNLERHARRLTRKYDRVLVFSGPLFIPKVTDSHHGKSKWHVYYEVIGQNLVAVPTHFFKIISYHADGHLLVESYIMPNKALPSNQPLHLFCRKVEDIERYSGLQFFTNLTRSQVIEEDIEKLYRSAKV